MPGIAASTSETWLLGSPPNSVGAPENSFEFEVTWACASSPITTSQSPVAPLISFEGFIGAFMLVRPERAPARFYPIPPRRDPSQPARRRAGTSRRHSRGARKAGFEVSGHHVKARPPRGRVHKPLRRSFQAAGGRFMG